MPDPQSSVQTLAGIALLTLLLRILVSIAAAVWIYRDADARRKNGIAAALIALLSGFYGMPFTVMVVCAWILFRPGTTSPTASQERLPDQLPSGIEASPSSEEFLDELERKT